MSHQTILVRPLGVDREVRESVKMLALLGNDAVNDPALTHL